MAEIAKIVGLLGGTATLGVDVRNDQDLVEVVRAGLPYGAVQAVIESNRLTRSELYKVVDRSMLARRRAADERLKPEDSDRIERVVRVIAFAEEVFDNSDKAHDWLRESNASLKGERPLDLLDTDPGARRVEAILSRIAYGVYS